MRRRPPRHERGFRERTIAMAVYKRKYRSGKTVWCFVVDAPGSTRENRRQIKESGFPTKAAAEQAEAERRVTEQKKHELEEAGLPDVPLPKTLAELLKDFFSEYAERKLARKTIERACIQRPHRAVRRRVSILVGYAAADCAGGR